MAKEPTIFLSRVKSHNGRRFLIVRDGKYKTLRSGRMIREYYGGFIYNLVHSITHKEVR